MIPLLEQLYKEIEHGDAEHRKWLWDKLEDFSRRKFMEYPCAKHEWERDILVTDLFRCKECGYITDDPFD